MTLVICALFSMCEDNDVHFSRKGSSHKTYGMHIEWVHPKHFRHKLYSESNACSNRILPNPVLDNDMVLLIKSKGKCCR